VSTTIEHHGTVAKASDILRYLLGRPRTQQRGVQSIEHVLLANSTLRLRGDLGVVAEEAA